jgi:hypothetical protein
MATLLDEPRSAKAIVEEKAKLSVVNSATFESIAKNHPMIEHIS